MQTTTMGFSMIIVSIIIQVELGSRIMPQIIYRGWGVNSEKYTIYSMHP